jgi:hypothetical protein
MGIFTTKNIIVFFVIVVIGVTVILLLKKKSESEESILHRLASSVGLVRSEKFDNFSNNDNKNISIDIKNNFEELFNNFLDYFDNNENKQKILKYLKNNNFNTDTYFAILNILQTYIMYGLANDDVPLFQKNKLLLLYISVTNSKEFLNYSGEDTKIANLNIDKIIIKYRIVDNIVQYYIEEKSNECENITKISYCSDDDPNIDDPNKCMPSVSSSSLCKMTDTNEMIKYAKDQVKTTADISEDMSMEELNEVISTYLNFLS